MHDLKYASSQGGKGKGGAIRAKKEGFDEKPGRNPSVSSCAKKRGFG